MGIIVVSFVSGASAATSESDGYVMADPVVQVNSQYIRCTVPCQCMEVADAISAWGTDGYVKCNEKPCAESEINGQGMAGGFYKFCLKKKPVTAVPVVNITTPVPVVISTTPVSIRMVADEAPPERYVVQPEEGQQQNVMPAQQVEVPAQLVAGEIVAIQNYGPVNPEENPQVVPRDLRGDLQPLPQKQGHSESTEISGATVVAQPGFVDSFIGFFVGFLNSSKDKVTVANPCLLNQTNCTGEKWGLLSPGEEKTYNYCADLSRDEYNCGKCGHSCGGSCVEGKCTCKYNKTPCAGLGDFSDTTFCEDIKTSRDNCGRCGSRCVYNETCKDGACIDYDTVPTGTVLDEKTYQNLHYDMSHNALPLKMGDVDCYLLRDQKGYLDRDQGSLNCFPVKNSLAWFTSPISKNYNSITIGDLQSLSYNFQYPHAFRIPLSTLLSPDGFSIAYETYKGDIVKMNLKAQEGTYCKIPYPGVVHGCQYRYQYVVYHVNHNKGTMHDGSGQISPKIGDSVLDNPGY